MTFNELAEKVMVDVARPALRRAWPQNLLAPSDSSGGLLGFGAKSKFWENIRSLREYTDSVSGNFSNEYEGSTGWEYSIMMVYVNGAFYYSSPNTSKNYTSVSSTHTVKVETEKRSNSNTLADKVFIDDKLVGTQTHVGQTHIDKRDRKIREGTYKMGFFCHFHSHPQVQYPEFGQRLYHFFSPQDVESFTQNNYPMMGLITDRLWLVGRTAEFMDLSTSTLHDLSKDLAEVSKAEMTDPDKYMTEVAGSVMSRYELVLYTGKFGGKLQRVA